MITQLLEPCVVCTYLFHHMICTLLGMQMLCNAMLLGIYCIVHKKWENRVTSKTKMNIFWKKFSPLLGSSIWRKFRKTLILTFEVINVTSSNCTFSLNFVYNNLQLHLKTMTVMFVSIMASESSVLFVGFLTKSATIQTWATYTWSSQDWGTYF